MINVVKQGVPMASHQRVGFIIPDSPDQMLPAGENAPLVEGDSR